MKNKDYYFKHDYNPTNDPKIICLIGNYGGLGYGIFWKIIEMLHQEKEYKLPLKKYIYEAIAKQMLSSVEQVEAIINECINVYELFVSDSVFFWSNRVFDNIEKQKKISNIRSLAGRAGAFAKQNLTKPAKEKKRKENKSIIERGEQSSPSPSPSQIIQEFIKNEEMQTRLINELGIKYNTDLNFIKNEINKFIAYWTEPTKSGKKQRWETEPTFELTRRLSTWFNNIQNFKKTQTYGKVNYNSQ